jgi:hypothetical protein
MVESPHRVRVNLTGQPQVSSALPGPVTGSLTSGGHGRKVVILTAGSYLASEIPNVVASVYREQRPYPF